MDEAISKIRYHYSMKIIVGLGNPGEKYKKTRHNVGFRVVDCFVQQQFSIFNFKFSKNFQAEMLQSDKIILVKPQTFMNDSGRAVRKIMDFYKLAADDLTVVHDDLDIVLGEFKIQKGKGPKIHNGVNSIEESLGTKDFWRIRVGIDARLDRIARSGEDYVLANFSREEERKLGEIIDRIIKEWNLPIVK